MSLIQLINGKPLFPYFSLDSFRGGQSKNIPDEMLNVNRGTHINTCELQTVTLTPHIHIQAPL